MVSLAFPHTIRSATAHQDKTEAAARDEVPEQRHPAFLKNRFDNAAVRVDEIAASFRDHIEREITRLHIQPYPANLTRPLSKREARKTAWWTEMIAVPLGDVGTHAEMPMDDLISSALANARQIRVFADIPTIRETGIAETLGRFNPEIFVEVKAERSNERTSSLAQTAGDDRAIRDEQALEAGLRKRFATGAEVTIGQRLANLESNSVEFDPEKQSRSTSFISIIQPLLRDSGLVYNNTPEEIARIDADVAVHEFRRQAESHLVEVARAYWNVYLSRALYLQQRRLHERTEPIVRKLENRRHLDVDQAQLTRAKAALQTRFAELDRARIAIRNAEFRLKALVNDPRIDVKKVGEIIPSDHPPIDHAIADPDSFIRRSIDNRPELQQAFLQHQAALLRQGMAAVESLPRLDLILEGSLEGGDDTGQFDQAFQDETEPGFVAGLRFTLPLGRHERKVRFDRRRIETRQQESQVRTAIGSIVLEGEISLNEYRVAYLDMIERYRALESVERESEIVQERWQQGLTSAGLNGVVFLERLLDAQSRLQQAEAALVASQVTHAVALTNLRRAQGTFLEDHRIEIARGEGADGHPVYELIRTPAR